MSFLQWPRSRCSQCGTAKEEDTKPASTLALPQPKTEHKVKQCFHPAKYYLFPWGQGLLSKLGWTPRIPDVLGSNRRRLSPTEAGPPLKKPCVHFCDAVIVVNIESVLPVECAPTPFRCYNNQNKKQTPSKKHSSSVWRAATCNSSTPRHPSRGFGSHSWHVALGFRNNQTGLLAPVHSQAPCFKAMIHTSVMEVNAHVL